MEDDGDAQGWTDQEAVEAVNNLYRLRGDEAPEVDDEEGWSANNWDEEELAEDEEEWQDEEGWPYTDRSE